MRETRLKLPVVALIGATRGMLGVGLGLLFAERIPKNRRIAVGCTLATIGLLSTIPLAITVFRNKSGKVEKANNMPRNDVMPHGTDLWKETATGPSA